MSGTRTWIESDGLATGGLGIAVAALVGEGSSQVGVRFGIGRLLPYGLAESVFGVARAALLLQGLAQPDVGRGRIGTESNRFPKSPFRLCMASLACQVGAAGLLLGRFLLTIPACLLGLADRAIGEGGLFGLIASLLGFPSRGDEVIDEATDKAQQQQSRETAHDQTDGQGASGSRLGVVIFIIRVRMPSRRRYGGWADRRSRLSPDGVVCHFRLIDGKDGRRNRTGERGSAFGAPHELAAEMIGQIILGVALRTGGTDGHSGTPIRHSFDAFAAIVRDGVPPEARRFSTP